MSSSETPSTPVHVVSKNGSSIIDVDSLKVPELKKRLKSMGLSIVGNKAELVERLQEAYLSEKDGSLDGTMDDDSLEEALLNDDQDQSALPETMIGNEEFNFSSPEKDVQNVTASNVSKPLKKRVIPQTSTPLIESPKPSKIVIKRDNYPTIEPPQAVAKKDHPLIEAPKSEDVSQVISEVERKQLRAKRFNIDSSAKADTAEKPSLKVKNSSGKTPITSVNDKITEPAGATVKGNNLEILRKRAERFGENVSTVMKKLENQEKLMKRKMKFTGGSIQTVSSTDISSSEQDKKKRRMERFGLIK